MDSLEEQLRELIRAEYGSVRKFAAAINVPAPSVYSALDRGMANTRTELTDTIYRALNIDWSTAKLDGTAQLKVKSSIPDSSLTDEELELVRAYRSCTPQLRQNMLVTARTFAGQSRDEAVRHRRVSRSA